MPTVNAQNCTQSSPLTLTGHDLTKSYNPLCQVMLKYSAEIL